jgi:hypothetical protein
MQMDQSRPFISRLGRRIITLSASLLVTIVLMVMPQLEGMEQELITLLVILPIASHGRVSVAPDGHSAGPYFRNGRRAPGRFGQSHQFRKSIVSGTKPWG